MDPNPFSQLNYWAIVASAVAAFVPGGAWYSPALFGKAWQRETGLSDAQLGSRNLGLVFGLAFALSLGASFVFAMSLGPKPALDPPVPEHFRPLAFLVGSCWKGTFPNGKSTDEHCFEWMLGKGRFIRDRHVVKGPEPDYSGETVYAYDAEKKKVVYRYFASPGFFTEGSLEYADEGIVFPEKVVAASGIKEMRTLFQPSAAGDSYRVRSMEKTPEGWKELWTMEMKKQAAR